MHGKIDVRLIADEGVELPFYASTGASGADVKAFISETISVPPGKMKIVPTGLRLEIPFGYEIQVRPRSGLAFKNQITILNTPGTIDADYRGELKIMVINLGEDTFEIEPGMRIAQLVLAPVIQANFIEVPLLVDTQRGAGGFGHTGTH